VIEQHELDFLRAFRSRRTVVAYSLFAFNILIFLLMAFAGGSNESTLLAFGVKANAQIDNGEVWRFITPIFIHIGLLHLAFNSYALWIVGPQVEKLYGGPRFLLLYVMTGIAGVAASYWYHPDIFSAGASGAIFGLFGVLLVFSFKYRGTIPAFFSQALSRGILLTVGINLFIGFQVPQIDNSAHLGGLLAGAFLASVVPFARPGETEIPVFKFLQSVLVILIAVSFFQVATHYNGPAFSFRNLAVSVMPSGGGASIGRFVDAINQAQQAFESSERALSSNDPRNFSESAEELGAASATMQRIPSLGGRADELSAELLDILQKQYEYLQEVQRTGRRRADFLGISPQSSRYARLDRQIAAWVDQEGERYGIVNSK